MKRLGAISVILVMAVVISIITVQIVQADWYAGNGRTSAYGAKADIYTPSSAPYLEESGESSWVSTPSPYYIQTGWRYYKGWPAARPYVEHRLPDDYDLNEYGTQSWGTSKEYKVSYEDDEDWWIAYIDGEALEMWGPIDAPTTVFGYSEVHQSSSNELDTDFHGVRWKNSQGQWNLFDQSNMWREDDPYAVEKTQYWYYRCYGP